MCLDLILTYELREELWPVEDLVELHERIRGCRNDQRSNKSPRNNAGESVMIVLVQIGAMIQNVMTRLQVEALLHFCKRTDHQVGQDDHVWKPFQKMKMFRTDSHVGSEFDLSMLVDLVSCH